VEGPAAAVLQLPALRELGCAYIGPVQAAALAAAAPLLPQLTQLDVGQLHMLDMAAIERGGLHPHMEGLGLGASADAARALFSTAGCLLGLLPLPRLLDLKLTLQQGDWAPLAGELAQQTSLTSLRLQADECCARAYDRNWVDLSALLLPALQQLASLKLLRLSTADLGLPCFQAIAAIPCLERLELDSCSFDVPHVALLHRCATLAEVSLVGCRLDDERHQLELEALLLPKPGLRVLEVSFDRSERLLLMRQMGDSVSDVPERVAGLLGVELRHR
jgi:hypothetical protein